MYKRQPLGQLQSWLYDRLREFCSWVTSGVDALIDELWSKYISPGLSAVSGAVSWIRTAVENIGNVLSSLASTARDIASAISNIPGIITDAFASFSSAIQNTLSNIISTIQGAVSGVVDAISPALSAISGGVQSIISSLSTLATQFVNAVKSIPGALKPLFDSILSALSSVGNAISSVGNAIKALPETIVGGIKGFIDTLWGWLQSAFGSLANALSAIQGAFASLAKSVTEGLGAISGAFDYLRGYIEGLFRAFGESVSGALKAVQDALTSAGQTISTWIQQASATIQGFVSGINKFPEWFPKWFKEKIADPISDALAGVGKAIWDALPDWLKDDIKALKDAWTDFVSGLEDFLKDPKKFIEERLGWLAKQIWELLPDWLKGAITTIQNAWNSFVEGLKDFLKNPVEFIQKRFQELTKWIWDHLPGWLKGAIQTIQNAWNSFVQGLQDFLKDPVKWISDRLQDFAKWIWDHLPEPVKWFIDNAKKALEGAWDRIVKFFTEDLPGFFGWLWENIQEFAKDPINWLVKNVAEPIWNALSNLWERVSAFFSDFARKAMSFFQDLGSKLQGAVQGAAQWAMGLATGLLNWFKGVTKPLAGAITNVLRPFLEDVPKEVAKSLSDYFKKLFAPGEGERPGELEVLPAIWLAVVPHFMTILLLPTGLKSLSHILAEVRGRIEGHLAPLGIGGKVVGTLISRFNKTLYELGKAMEKVPVEFLKSLGVGTAIISMLPLRYPLRYAWKQYFRALGLGNIPFELPPLSETIRLARRVGVGESKGYVQGILEYRGYPDWFIKYAVAVPEELHVTIKDRFGTDRLIPLSLLYEQPSLSDLCRFMIRDIFGAGVRGYEAFKVWAERLGMHENVALLYYLLHFRYPSPEQLSRFYWRGIAKVLWSPGLPRKREEVEEFIRKTGLGKIPSPPKELNDKPDILNKMMASYMKWHDYFPLAWDNEFPADIDIIHDLMADLPTKIDIRWMVRWALLEQLSKVGFDMGTSIEELVDKMRACKGDELLAQKVSPGIAMDVSVMARLIEATGMHPYWTPLVAVAEAINALADEKTLVRTGFINAYKEGLITLDNSEQLLSGLFVTTFRTGYIDPATGEAVPFDYKVPLAWLPAERRLLQIRAAFDRTLDLFREGYRAIASAVRLLVWTPEEAHERLASFSESLRQYLSKQLKALTGVDVKLSTDVEYLERWIEMESMVAEVELAMRKRWLAQRILGWLLYRVSWGWVTIEELKGVADALMKYFEFTPSEAEAIVKLGEVVLGIVRREQYPAPSTLGTWAEYMVVPEWAIEEVLEMYNIPDKYRPLWRRYIGVKPVKSDYKAVLSAALRALKRGAISEDLWKSILANAERFGFTDVEIELLDMRASLEMLVEEAKEFIPTLGTLASMMEYIDVPNDLVVRVFEARRVREPWASLWMRYAMARSIASETNTMVSTFRGLLERYAMPQEIVDQVVALMKQGGWTARELEIFQVDLTLRRIRRILDTFVPTLREFISDAQYLGEWEALLEDWLRARGIEAEKYRRQVEYYRKLIKSRKIHRRLSWYITRLLNAYCADIIDRNEARRRLERFKTYGLSDEEIDILLEGFELEKAYRYAIYGPPGGGSPPPVPAE